MLEGINSFLSLEPFTGSKPGTSFVSIAVAIQQKPHSPVLCLNLPNSPSMRKLREALQVCFTNSPDAELVHDQISSIELLNGVIWETLRLFPPNPSHPTRVTPPEGAIIAGRFVAGRTQVMAPQYVIGRGEHFLFR